MKHDLFISRMVFVVFFALLPLVVPGTLSAAKSEKGERSLLKPKDSSLNQIALESSQDTLNLNQIAVESVQDTLKACLGRIPADASAGQLKLAEQNCQQVDVERQEVHLTF